mmetsp:Transcript_11080/g.33223  ORF Transcript_11080/g.33223 Transcript_11080/m.33223 type:complete len:81 (+) Transcript_11080:2-244(+)
MPLYERSLAITEKTVGPNHTDVAVSLSGFAVVLSALSQHEKALKLGKRALGIFERLLGSEHPHTKITRERIIDVESKCAK